MKVLAIILAVVGPYVASGQVATSTDVLREAAAAFESGDTASAIRLYREFLKEYSDAAEIRSNLASALVRAGQFAEAIDEYKLAIAQIPHNPNVRMNLALAYYKLGRIPEATQHLEVLRQAQPLETRPALLLADCVLQSGQPERAVELLTLFEREYPDDRAITYLLGVAFLKQDQTDQAKTRLDKILRDGESAESAYLLGQSAYLGQDKVAAARHLERAIQLNPALPGAHSLYAVVLREIGKPESVPEQFREELKRNPYDFIANLEMSTFLKQDRKLDEALVHVERALQVRPADPGALYQRASIHTMKGNTEQARRELEQLTRDYPNFAEAHAALATVYYRLKRKADGDGARAAAARAQQESQKRLEENRNRVSEPKAR